MAQALWYRERIEPLQHAWSHGTLREHIARYRFAAELARGRVLDAGCGTGYGVPILAGNPAVREVVGVDADARAVAHARRYYSLPAARFTCADLLAPQACALGVFDTIVCLEVLEHLSDPERLLRTLDLSLAPGGRLLISTPLGRGRGFPSAQPGHAFQLRRVEFEMLLCARFDFRLYGQKGEGIEGWQRGGRYFLMLAVCRSRSDERCRGQRGSPCARCA